MYLPLYVLTLERRPDICNVNRGGCKTAPSVSPERIEICLCGFDRLVGEPEHISCGALGRIFECPLAAQLSSPRDSG